MSILEVKKVHFYGEMKLKMITTGPLPSIFAVLRNLVREIWFEKSGSRNLVRE